MLMEEVCGCLTPKLTCGRPHKMRAKRASANARQVQRSLGGLVALRARWRQRLTTDMTGRLTMPIACARRLIHGLPAQTITTPVCVSGMNVSCFGDLGSSDIVPIPHV